MIVIKEEKYYNPTEVAEKFGVSVGTIAKWRQRGWLPASKIGERRFLYSEKDLEKLLGEKT